MTTGYTTVRDTTLTIGGVDLLRPLAGLARIENIHVLLAPASAVAECRRALDLLGGHWIFLVADRMAALYSSTPYPAAMLRRLELAPGVAWTPTPGEYLGPVAVATALMFAADGVFGDGLLAEVSDSLNA